MNKVLQNVGIAEALIKPGVPNGAHQYMVTSKDGSSEGDSVGRRVGWNLKTFSLRLS